MDLYHALNRGVDKRSIFLDDQDRARFVHDMYEFNDTKRAISTFRHSSKNNSHVMDDVVRRPYRKREQIVDIHGWCLMGNHYHLLLSQRIDGGIPLFLKKLNGGYAKYFNERYERSGALFQGKTKKIHIDSDSYLLHILNYIHFNPLDTNRSTSEWRSLKVTSPEIAFTTLNNYRWSSYFDYIGKRNFPSIITTSFFSALFKEQYKSYSEKYILDIDSSIKEKLTDMPYNLEK
jgi:putative transposase